MRARHGGPIAVDRSAWSAEKPPALRFAETGLPFDEGGLGAFAKVIARKHRVCALRRLRTPRALPFHPGATHCGTKGLETDSEK